MPLPIVFWGLDSPSQLVFHDPLPEETETRDIREDPMWVEPFMTRPTRFPMMGSKHPKLAWEMTWKAYNEGPDKYLLTVWCWDTYKSEPGIKLRFFRNPSAALHRFGDTGRPHWFEVEEEAHRTELPTKWDRLLDDDF